LEGLSGRVVEIGAGQGLNFSHYPESVTEVVAVEPEPTLRALAAAAAREGRVPISVVAGIADALPVEDASCDAVVASLVLCSVPNQVQALTEIRRALRPHGQLRFYEHVASKRRGSAWLEKLADATFWPHIAGGCHLHRDTTSAIESAGFTFVQYERFRFSPGRLYPAAPHILGAAVVGG
jgi:ubiquinone/menaquinone biosynthesis C-methylase UbiE